MTRPDRMLPATSTPRRRSRCSGPATPLTLRQQIDSRLAVVHTQLAGCQREMDNLLSASCGA
jgi:hypothetical protein